ncbi:MAG: hypothetical protein M1831_001595 [Alyxoria varia]|nr:MAG: hypothetical protein M1831_001595 [Alyxoria varia]
MAEVNALIDHLKSLNDARQNGADGAQEEMVEQIGELKRIVQTPWETLWESRYQTLNSLCKRMAIEIGAIEAILNKNGGSVSAEEISKETEHDQQVIERILRVLSNMGIIAEKGKSLYASNQVTRLFLAPGSIANEKYFFDYLFPIGANLIQYMNEEGIKQFSEEGQKGPFEFTFGNTIWEYLTKNPAAKEHFDCTMTGRREGGPVQWFTTYPAFLELPSILEKCSTSSDVKIVDVAGNKGHDLVAFSKAHPDISSQLILEDLPITFARMAPQEKTELLDAGIIMQSYDFFMPQPIEGALVYFFRDICHDWPDKQARKFLANTVAAMKAGYSKMLIEDHIVDEQGAHHIPATSDILMMLVLGGIERTLEQWTSLLASVGLIIVKIWPSRRGYQSVIEAEKEQF